MRESLIIGFLILFYIIVGFLFMLGPSEILDENVSGLFLRPSVWSGEVHIDGDVYAPPWATIYIQPGTKILFGKGVDGEEGDWISHADAYIKDHDDPTGREGYEDPHYEILGKIIATGTKKHPITITSAQPNPEYADWNQITALKGSYFEYVNLSYSHNGITVWGGNTIIRNSVVHDSLWSCIDIFSTGNIVENTEVYHCWHQAIGIKEIGWNMIRSNSIHDAKLSLNCENGARPTHTLNTVRFAPIGAECGDGDRNTIIEGVPDVEGGTYGGRVVYPFK